MSLVDVGHPEGQERKVLVAEEPGRIMDLDLIPGQSGVGPSVPLLYVELVAPTRFHYWR